MCVFFSHVIHDGTTEEGSCSYLLPLPHHVIDTFRDISYAWAYGERRHVGRGLIGTTNPDPLFPLLSDSVCPSPSYYDVTDTCDATLYFWPLCTYFDDVTIPMHSNRAWQPQLVTTDLSRRRNTADVVRTTCHSSPLSRYFSARLYRLHSPVIIMDVLTSYVNVTTVCHVLEPLGVKPCAVYASETLSLASKSAYFTLLSVWGKLCIPNITVKNPI